MEKKNLLRIVNDLNDLQENSPEGIYLYINKKNFMQNYALIVGPKNTPYFGGFFLFEINFPSNYPNKPPQVKLLTIDEKVRFNPNLYENGKVCLSILGTWAGPAWRPVMNLRLVLLSIQSLMGEYPVRNEPGMEKILVTDKVSINYNYFIIYHTYRLAFIDILNGGFKKYTKYFKKAIKEELEKNYETLKADLQSYCVSLNDVEFGKIIYFLPNENKLNFKKLLEDFEKIKKLK